MTPLGIPVGPTRGSEVRGRAFLITGGLGTIGSALARALVSRGARVTVIDDLDPLQSGSMRNVAGIEDRLEIVVADLCAAPDLARLVEGKDIILDLAGRSSHTDSMSDPLADVDANVRARLRLLEACRVAAPAARLVFTSTRQVYGRALREPVGEDHPTRPLDVNGVSKLAAEGYHRVYAEAYGLRTTILRITNTYGPGMRVRDARQMFLGAWIRAILEGTPIEVWGGSQRRDLVYVDDVVDAIVLAATADAAVGETFNVSGDEAIPLADLADLLVEVNGGGTCVRGAFPEDRARIDVGDIVTDSTRIRQRLGWRPAVPLRDGLGRTLAFYREHLAGYTADA